MTACIAEIIIKDVDIPIKEDEHVICWHCGTVLAVRDLRSVDGDGYGKEKSRYFYCDCDDCDAVVYQRGKEMILSFPGPSRVVRSLA